jgi:hypothetical protein
MPIGAKFIFAMQMSTTNKAEAVKDRGGSRSGTDRRQKASGEYKKERRNGKDRRAVFDRRSGISHERDKNQQAIERRDIFRKRK